MKQPRRSPRRIAAALATVVVLAGTLTTGPVQAKNVITRCQNGEASWYRCKGIHLQSFVPAEVMAGAGIADVWGWVDPETRKEYAVLGSTRGVQFLDVTVPTAPVYLGWLAGKGTGTIWQEIEILNGHAYIVCEQVSACGLQVFDLTRLRGVENAPSQPWVPDAVYPIGTAHTIDSNPATDHLFINGTAFGDGGPVILDVSRPLDPRPVGAMMDDGYSHDTLCRNYKGPDKRYRDNEICFNFNIDRVTIYDVTANPTLPVKLARGTYERASYIHSGALSKDHSTLISTDEGDEQDHGIRSTLYIWDVSKLTKPKMIGTFVGNSGSIDHNVYSEADALFHANYVNGFRILDLENAHKGRLREVAWFDTVPTSDGPVFDGAWAVYPYLPSGNMLVGNMRGGLFILRPEPAVLARLGVERGKR
ncbi:MAG: choice-of-anchor B family protein [Actinomycetota bacterium]